MIPINFVAVMVAAVAAFIVGFLWHGPLFGKQWMKLSGMKMPEGAELEKAKKEMWKPMLANLGINLVMAYCLAHIIYVTGVYFNALGSVGNALGVAFWTWLGFVAVVTMSPVLWEKMSFAKWTFTNAYWFVVMCVMSVIIALWQ